jgi:hypothetical protein
MDKGDSVYLSGGVLCQTRVPHRRTELASNPMTAAEVDTVGRGGSAPSSLSSEHPTTPCLPWRGLAATPCNEPRLFFCADWRFGGGGCSAAASPNPVGDPTPLPDEAFRSAGSVARCPSQLRQLAQSGPQCNELPRAAASSSLASSLLPASLIRGPTYQFAAPLGIWEGYINLKIASCSRILI